MQLASYLLLGTLALAGCARSSMERAPVPTPPPATPQAAPAPADAASELPGTWDFTADVMGETTTGVLTITREGGSLGGTVTSSVFPNVTLSIGGIETRGDRVTIVVASPEGDVTLQGMVSDGEILGQWFAAGDSGPFHAKKRG